MGLKVPYAVSRSICGPVSPEIVLPESCSSSCVIIVIRPSLPEGRFFAPVPCHSGQDSLISLVSTIHIRMVRPVACSYSSVRPAYPPSIIQLPSGSEGEILCHHVLYMIIVLYMNHEQLLSTSNAPNTKQGSTTKLSYSGWLMPITRQYLLW